MLFFVVQGCRAKTRAFSIQNSMKKVKRDKKARKDVTLHSNESSLNINDALNGVSSPSEDDLIQDNNVVSSTGSSAITIPTRSTVLTACTVTSGLIAALGILIRQVTFTFRITRQWHACPPLIYQRIILENNWSPFHHFVLVA